jgi:neamine transaminase/2'-deamino-2'-hydroxyneamine transaminase/neomycin C transaminase
MDGERWIDLDNGRGSVLLGHGDARVAEAIRQAASGGLGTTTGWSPLLDSVLERAWSLLGGETLAVFRTGTSALRSVAVAVRDARAEQLGVARPIIVSAGYHGYDPMWRSPETPFDANADGIVDFLFDLDVLEDLLRRPEPVAALIISPDSASLTTEWYGSVRALARNAGVPIVADEVKVGLRYGPELVARSLEPDVWVVAKTIANGAPIAITGGRADLLAGLEEVSFTSFFEPTVLAAADATLARVATGEPQRRIAEHGETFIRSARASLEAAQVPIAIGGDAHLFHFVCASDEIETAFLSACAAEKLLLYAGDNQAPSAALAGDALTDACSRFALVCDALGGRFTGLEISEDAWYGAAWNVIDGLAARPRDRRRTRELVARFWDD